VFCFCKKERERAGKKQSKARHKQHVEKKRTQENDRTKRMLPKEEVQIYVHMPRKIFFTEQKNKIDLLSKVATFFIFFEV